MNLNRLRVFATVAERLSFTLAAGDLHLTQPAVSQQVKALERSLGVRLFERQANQLSLTEAGRLLRESALTMLRAEEHATRALAGLSGARGTLSVGANTTGGMYFVPDLLGAFRERHPEAEIVLHVAPAVRIYERLHQRIIDVAFAGGPIDDPRFLAEPIAEDPLVLIFSPRHRFAGRAAVALAALAEEVFVMPEATSLTRQLIERTFRQAGIVVRVGHQLHETEPVKKAVEANLGVALVSAKAVERELASGLLSTAAIEGVSFPRRLEMITVKARTLTPLGERFRRFTREFFGARRSSRG